MKAWLAKDGEGHLFLYRTEPVKHDPVGAWPGYWCGKDSWEHDLDESQWPELYEKYKDKENMTCWEVEVEII